MKPFLLAVAICSTIALPSAARAQEVFGGIYAHAVGTPLSLGSSRENGADLQLGYRFGRTLPATGIRPHLYGQLNSNGDTSFVAAGLSWKFGDRLYVRPGVGLALHNGSSADFNQDDRIAFGSRILFAPEIGIGTRINERLTIEASLVHLSHAQLFGGQNPGIDNVGVRLNLQL